MPTPALVAVRVRCLAPQDLPRPAGRSPQPPPALCGCRWSSSLRPLLHSGNPGSVKAATIGTRTRQTSASATSEGFPRLIVRQSGPPSRHPASALGEPLPIPHALGPGVSRGRQGDGRVRGGRGLGQVHSTTSGTRGQGLRGRGCFPRYFPGSAGRGRIKLGIKGESFPSVLHSEGRQASSANDQRVSIFGFVTRTQLYRFRARAATGEM